jgi:hypothetical protein
MANLRCTYAELVSIIKSTLSIPAFVKDIETYGDLIYISISKTLLIPIRQRFSLSFDAYDNGTLILDIKPGNLIKLVSMLGLSNLPCYLRLEGSKLEIDTKQLLTKLNLNIEIQYITENNGELLIDLQIID